MRITTWNMQGGTNSMNSKWSEGVAYLLTSGVYKADVVCLQEAGSPPPGANLQAAPPWLPYAPAGHVVYGYYIWQTGRFTFTNILWLQTDPNGNRVNLAICAPAEPEALLYANPDPANARSRSPIGLCVPDGTGHTFDIFTIHALSGGGTDAPVLIDNINAAVGQPWNAAGDFNRDPITWVPPYGTICPPAGPTHERGGNLDYMVATTGGVEVGGTVLQLNLSDHSPVRYVL